MSDWEHMKTEESLRDELSRLRELVKEMRGALSPFADFARHYPVGRKYGNRPTTGTLLAVESGVIGESHITVEHLHEAASLLAKADSILNDRPEQDRVGCQGGKCRHASDCAVHNGDLAGVCDCGADAILKETSHD